jgi:peptide-methionine (S)-S-oxide reductase
MRAYFLIGLALVGCATAAAYNAFRHVEQREPGVDTSPLANSQESTSLPMQTEKATFAAGCFWGVEEAFRQLPGVVRTAVGYTGGHAPNPTYELVCSDRTGHAEAVEIEYDPAQVTYEDLLALFFKLHDPTTKNRQGPDVGSQYRSAIFYHSDEQRQAAEAAKFSLQASGKFHRPIVTQIVPATDFYRAEEYHQQYFAKSGEKSCHVW